MNEADTCRVLVFTQHLLGALEELLDMISVPKTAAGLKGAFRFTESPQEAET